MSTIPARWSHTQAVADVIASAGVLVGIGVKPDGAGWQGSPRTSVFKGYAILHSIAGGSLDGSLAFPDDDAHWVWQPTVVGSTVEQCESIADKVRTALLTTPVDIAGRNQTRLLLDVPDGARPDDGEPADRLWICTERYRLSTTPT